MTTLPLPSAPYWTLIKDGDKACRSFYECHYSAHKYVDGRKPSLFVGPGEKMVLLVPTLSGVGALFAWRKFIDDSGQKGVNCAVFRNITPILSSMLILEAEKWAWCRWPGERLYTYVNANRIKSVNPGYCFIKAGWRSCGHTKGGLLILEKEATR